MSIDNHSILGNENPEMEIRRRLFVQEFLARLAKVHSQKDLDNLNATVEAELNDAIPAHPFLDKQQFDGCDPSLNAAPQGNPKALAEYNNQLAEQLRLKQELQNRLNPEYSYSLNNTITPRI